MFSITCKCCASKLKVLQVSAIGQRLACPKCGEIVEIIAPEGWSHPAANPSASLGNSANALPSSAGIESPMAHPPGTGGDFDDVVSLIQQPASVGSTKPPPRQPVSATPASAKTPTTQGAFPAPTKNSPASIPASQPARREGVASKPAGAAQSPRATRSPADAAQTSFELAEPAGNLEQVSLPGPGWSTRRKSQWHLFFIALCGCAGLAVVVIALVTMMNRPARQTVVQRQEPSSPSDPTLNPSSDPSATKSTESTQEMSAEKKASGESVPSAARSSNGLKSEIDQSGATPLPEMNKPPVADTGSTESSSPSITEEPAASDSSKSPTAPVASDPNAARPASDPPPAISKDSPPVIPQESPLKTLGESPLLPGELPNGSAPSDTIPPANSSMTDRLGNLSQLLAGPGMTLKELSDIAEAERNDRQVGLPRFSIIQPTRANLSGDPWSLPIVEAVYQDVPLARFLQDVSQLSGLPIDLDAQALQRHGLSVAEPVSVKLEGITIRELLESVLLKFDLQFVEDEGVVVIEPRGARTIRTEPIAFPPVQTPTPEKFETFAQNVPKLIAPGSWTADPQPAGITVVDQQMMVAQNVRVIDQIREFISKLTAASQLKANPADVQAAAALASRSERAAPALAIPLRLVPTIDQRLETFLGKIQEQSGVTICLDWSALAVQGWTPQAEVPGDFNAENVGQLLKELARSLDATFLAVDAHCFVITSFEVAARHHETEIYPLHAQSLQPDQILALLFQTLGPQIRNDPAIQVIYEPEGHCLIAIAPQSMQRQIEAILKRLASPGE